METIDEAVERFLTVKNGDGYGYGYGSGYGDGYGYGYGSGYGSGYGYGYGHGYGYGDGYGYGSGSGYGDGDGYGYGHGYGSGDGSGDGDGSGSGEGYGYGYGYGHGYGSGSGYGDGDGYGYGYGIEEFDNHRVYLVDDVQTIFYSVRGNYARGAMLNSDLTLTPCYIARVGNCFAHGDTLREARRDAEAKALEDMPTEERIERFKAAHPDLDTPYSDLFEWHHILTGSCTAGREQWCKEHGYKSTDSITVRTFIDQTKGNYGGDIIRELAEAYDYKLS